MENLPEESLDKNMNITEPVEIETTEIMDMGQLLAQEAKVSENGPRFLMAIAVSIIKEGLLVDIGGKREALIPRAEFEGEIPFKAGDSIPVLKSSGEKAEGYFRVSWKAAREKLGWEEIEKAFQNKVPLTVQVVKEIKGGLLVNCNNGLQGFLPASQVDVRQNSDLKSWKGKSITVYVIQYDIYKNNLVFSRKGWVLEENQKKKEELLKVLKVGDIFKGIVRGMTPYGAFVDIGGLEGLLHIGEVDWSHTKKLSQILKMGQEIEVKVIKLDLATEKVSLSRKELLPHPWEGVEEKFKIGMVVKGKVTHCAEFGAFVEIAPNVEGLVHNSEISWEEEVKNPKNHLKVGQIYEAKILNISREKEKISLSIKRVQLSPWEAVSRKYPAGSTVKVKITSFAPFGAFAKIPEGLNGLIHISDFSWTKKIEKPEEILQIEQEVDVKVLEIHPLKEKMSFGLKQMKGNPYDQFYKRSRIKGKITQILEAGAFVDLGNEVEGFIPYSEISSEKFNQLEEVLKIGEEIEGIVTLTDPKEKRIQISIAQLERELQKTAQKKYSKVQGTSLSQLFEQ